MKTNNDFINYFNDFYNEKITFYSKFIRKRQNKQILKTIALGLIIFFSIAVLIYNSNDSKDFFNITMISIFAIILLFAVYHVNVKFTKDISSIVINEKILVDIMNFITDDTVYTYFPENRVGEEYLSQTNLFNLDLINYDGNNFTYSEYLNKRIIFADINLYTAKRKIEIRRKNLYGINNIWITRKRTTKDIFNGLYFDVKLNKNNNDLIYLIPNNLNDKLLKNKILNYISYKGTKIELENLDFSKKYSVYSYAENQSRYVLSLPLMEKINELDKLFTNKKYIIFRPDGKIGIFIENFTISNILKQDITIKKGKITDEYLINFFEKINNIYKIHDILDLNNDLYS